jgi:hypothetical protein
MITTSKISTYQKGALFSGCIVALLEVSARAGWMFNIAPLKRAYPGLVEINVNTAKGMILPKS